jgi:L-fuconolactonase
VTVPGAPPPERIDAHQHFWRLDRGDYGWLTPDMAPIYRDFGPGDLEPALRRAGIDRTVLVQAAPTVAETRHLLEVARRTPFVAGVVGWVPFDAPDGPDLAARLAGDPRLRGLRPMIHDLPDPAWMLGSAVGATLRALPPLGLAFDALVRPLHLPPLRRLLDRHPDLTVVIDHGAKPAIAAGGWQPWAGDLVALARESPAVVKLSGLVTEAAPDWSVAGLRRYADHLLEHFGPARVLFGSDWPVVLRRASYAEWVAAAEALLAGLDAAGRAAVLGGNAVRVYRLAPGPSPAP